MTEQLLFQAFDLQRFAPQSRLQAVIDASHARTEARELTDDELDFVAAAGATELPTKPKECEQ